MNEVRLSHGMRPDTGLLVSVEEVESGAGCGLVCPECRHPLIAAKGRQYRHHFRHQAEDVHCVGALETMRHKLGKQVLVERAGVWLPPLEVAALGKTGRFAKKETIVQGGAVGFASVALEVALDSIRPDAVGELLFEADGLSRLAVEVFVTHECSEQKKAAFARLGLAAIEIQASGYSEAAHGDYAEYVLRDAPRWWLFHPAVAPTLARLTALVEAAEEEERQAQRERAAQVAREAEMAAKWAAEERKRRDEAAAQRAQDELAREDRTRDAWRLPPPIDHTAYCNGLLAGYRAHAPALRPRRDAARSDSRAA
jgi:hypothetical protein